MRKTVFTPKLILSQVSVLPSAVVGSSSGRAESRQKKMGSKNSQNAPLYSKHRQKETMQSIQSIILIGQIESNFLPNRISVFES